MSRSRLRSAAQNGALVAASLLLALGVFEIGLRLLWSDYYLKFRDDGPGGRTRFHPTRGWALNPAVRLTHGDPEFTVSMTHNRDGFRGGEIAVPKPEDRLRVLVLGDSMTYGHGVEDHETYSAVLDRMDPRLEVINAGVGAYSGVQQLLTLREEIGRLEPDVVVLGFFWNDLPDAAASRYGRFELDGGRLRYVPPEDPGPDHPAFADRNRRRRERAERYDGLLARTYTARFVSDRFKLLRLNLRDWFGGGGEMERALAPDEIEPAWRLSLALIREMARTAERAGADFVLVAIPDQVQVESDVRVAGVPDFLFEVQQRLRAFAAAEGIAYVDLLPALREGRARDGQPYFFRFDRHWNARGHRRAAEALYPVLAQRADARALPAAAAPAAEAAAAEAPAAAEAR